jgi:uncharacterized protein YjiK
MTILFWCIFLFITADLTACGQTEIPEGNSSSEIDYDLSAPGRVYILPASLHEISGITEVDASSIACVQDEHGIIFIHDINRNLITRQFFFAAEGDYEGIARVDNTLFVLRSDEMLTEIMNFRSDKLERRAHMVNVPGKDTEGLCYDKDNNRLLIAPKENPDDKSGNKDKRFIYGFDLASKSLIKDPVISFDIKAIERFVLDNNIKVPMKGKKGEDKKPDIKMQISAVGIHPVTKRLFVISGPERILFVFDMKGNIEYIERLDSDLFPQPEGITFMKNGDMFISSEGGKRSATLVRFNYKPAAASKSGAVKP